MTVTTKDIIPLRWVQNDRKGAEFAFRQNDDGAFTFFGVPIQADFKLSYDSLAPYVTSVLDQETVITINENREPIGLTIEQGVARVL